MHACAGPGPLESLLRQLRAAKRVGQVKEFYAWQVTAPDDPAEDDGSKVLSLQSGKLCGKHVDELEEDEARLEMQLAYANDHIKSHNIKAKRDAAHRRKRVVHLTKNLAQVQQSIAAASKPAARASARTATATITHVSGYQLVLEPDSKVVVAGEVNRGPVPTSHAQIMVNLIVAQCLPIKHRLS
jgi:hypothetical protein